MKNQISVIVLTKNSEQYIKECLEALVIFDEVIILDNGSTDNTMSIVEKFTNVSLHRHEFIGFGPLKQLAVSLTKNDWVLSIDSDEILSESLLQEIINLELNQNYVYSIARDNYYNKKLVQCCGWKNDRVDRLFNKNRVNFNDKQVHESLKIEKDTTVVNLNGPLKHYTFDTIEQLIVKMDKYSTLYAQEHKGKKNSSPLKAFIRGFYAFIKNYFLQKGFLCGYEGLVISISNANGVFYKYMKLFEENKK